jgi:hypothetical protein
MNSGNKFEDRASGSQGKHGGESSAHLCDRLCRTRDASQRQLPTDHDYAVSTREYQTDQSSPKTAPAVASPVFGKRQNKRQRQKQPHRFAGIDRSLHIRRVWDKQVDVIVFAIQIDQSRFKVSAYLGE